MFSMIFLKSRSLPSIPLVVVALLYGGSSLFAQTKPPSAAQAQSAAPAMQDPTHPEVQRPLDVDRDPIPSPDPENTTPANAASSSTANQTKELQKEQNGMYRLHADVDEVILNCTVIDDKGQAVRDLSQGDFHVWEDGVPQTVNSVLHQDLPVSMGILVDNSGSMLDKRSAVATAAYNLLKASNPQDAAFVVNFSDRAFLDQGFTSDLVALHRGLSRYDSKGTTALYDAVAASAEELSKHGKHRKQVLLIITDGSDNASRLDLDQAIHRVQNLGGPVVYSIGLLFDVDKPESERARDALERLSQQTGGIAYFPRSLQDIDPIAAEVARDIRNQYTVDYRSTKPANQGGYRTVHVEASASNHGKLTVRTRQGYFANPEQHKQAAEEANQ